MRQTAELVAVLSCSLFSVSVYASILSNIPQEWNAEWR